MPDLKHGNIGNDDKEFAIFSIGSRGQRGGAFASKTGSERGRNPCLMELILPVGIITSKIIHNRKKA